MTRTVVVANEPCGRRRPARDCLEVDERRDLERVVVHLAQQLVRVEPGEDVRREVAAALRDPGQEPLGLDARAEHRLERRPQRLRARVVDDDGVRTGADRDPPPVDRARTRAHAQPHPSAGGQRRVDRRRGADGRAHRTRPRGEGGTWVAAVPGTGGHVACAGCRSVMPRASLWASGGHLVG
ncbi:hypothetical protein CPE01_13660 [Cellulomonas persica]|uniref:Uncharacterized protein n=1 Tax=Cellulomonas persica TaxID=76861 RepID=A0A510USK7_9CELL|nr:hypothetical protein CPE01_13660 [Cellulomonas persica]